MGVGLAFVEEVDLEIARDPDTGEAGHERLLTRAARASAASAR
jgi:hypothetical protein